jgi:hypothetical protein
MKPRILWIERKDDTIVGPARIGRVTFSKSGRTLHHAGRAFRSLGGAGSKANYYDIATGEHYWISGCRHDGRDALYSTTVDIDDDVREEYWTVIRGMPEQAHVASFRVPGKYTR